MTRSLMLSKDSLKVRLINSFTPFLRQTFYNSSLAYQTEIDSLTKRCKTAENAFLNVYKVIAEAPDPYPLLEVAVDQTVKVSEAREQQQELQRLREENTEMRKRLADAPLVEAAKRKADAKVEQLEQKASLLS